MNRRRFRFAAPALAFALALASVDRPAGAVPTSPISIDPTNPQYFFYDNQTIALVGTSAEYLCHVIQPDRVGYYCTFADYPAFLADLQARGLNKMRLWLGLNHSPGREPNRPGFPYDFEQPFVYNSTTGLWDWDNFSQKYFNAVFGVIQAASNAGVIVEVVLFDPWSGDWTKGPWHPSRNNRGKGFTSRNKFVTGTVSGADLEAQNKQLEFVDRIATELNPLHNFYWEIANEPDLISSGSSLPISAITDWHDKVIQRLRAKEATLPNGHHLIAVNYHTNAALATVRDNTYPLSVPHIGLVSGHYVAVSDYGTGSSQVRNGAIELENSWQIGPSASLAKAFGFNETRISPFQTTLRSMRAEAWEFLLKEGGSYDHYGYDWQSTSAGNYRTQLGKLASFLRGLDLRNMARPTGTAPFWVSGLGTYGTGNKYWAAMQKVRHQYVLYVHHSVIDFAVPGNPAVTQFAKYTPVAGSFSESLNVNLGSIAGTFDAEWIDPATGNVLSSVLGIAWNPATMPSVNLVSPTYAFDIALRVKRRV